MNERQSKLLVAIIDQFIGSASPVGSKKLLESGEFVCSSATIRNEMSFLEDEGFLTQPHVSAGRIPTAKGYRSYVLEYMKPAASEKLVRDKFNTLKEQYFQQKDQERVYEAVSLLSRLIPNVAFATVPHKDRVYYMGLANALRAPEFQDDPRLACSVAELLEGKLDTVLDAVEVDDKIRYYIGESDILGGAESCSLMVTEYAMRGEKGVLGILGPLRMDYGYNTIALESVVDLLQTYA